MDIWVVLVIILVLVLVWRGPKTLPSLGRAFGRGVREAREEAAKAQAEIQSRTTTDPDDLDSAPGAPTSPTAPTVSTAPAAPPASNAPTPPTDRTPPGAG
jgi:Sec-independent protein translocase protein TatA